jgi:hypothetical protein
MGVRTLKQLLAVTIACAVLVPTVADAQGRGRGRGAEPWQASAPRNTYDRGYREGVLQGEQDARGGRPFRRGNNGRSDYNVGFADGYRAGYDRQHAAAPFRGRRDVPAQGRGYQEPAFASGFNGGYEKGLSDGRDGDRYDPVRHSDYRNADRGYSSSYGSKDAYKNNYRAGFRQGYEQGYRDGTRNRR